MFATYEHQGAGMAIFSKKNSAKRSDEQAKVILDGSLEGRPVEQSPVKESAAAEAAAEPPAASPAIVAESMASDPVAAAPARPEPHRDDIEPESDETPPIVPVVHPFGIDDAIQLMRTLPTDSNTALVVRVVRVTLGALNVSVEEIVADATRKESRIKESIATIEGQIVELDKRLAILRSEIAAHQADLKETANVRERLHMADQFPGGKPPPTPIAATLARLSSSKPIAG
jgi:uncharacterized small protein (DUF1192 family)